MKWIIMTLNYFYFRITGTEDKVRFLKDLRFGWNGVLAKHSQMPSDISWNEPKGQILE